MAARASILKPKSKSGEKGGGTFVRSFADTQITDRQNVDLKVPTEYCSHHLHREPMAYPTKHIYSNFTYICKVFSQICVIFLQICYKSILPN
jgi:hypothetical protein